MHIRAKFDGGKQINRSQRGSWNARCAGAALRYNEGPTWGPTCWEKVTSNPPNNVFVEKSLAHQQQTENDRKRKASTEAKQQRKKAKLTTKADNNVNAKRAYSRHDGSNVDDISTDLPTCDLQDLMVSYYKANIVVNDSRAAYIQLTTMKHGSDNKASILWKEERRLRVTSSNVGAIAKRRSTTKVGPLVHQLLYSSFRGNRATSWGLLQEEDTEKQYQEYMKEQCADFKVNGNCGLYVSTQYPWLAATPDGLVHDPSITPSRGLVEYKNPHTCRNSTIIEAMRNKKIKFLTIINDKVSLKRSHQYYYQIQTAMLCTETQWCDFVVRTSIDFQLVERIRLDEEFCSSFIIKVREFYFNSILPEITVKRTPIREPEWVDNTEEWNERVAELSYTNK